MSKHTEGPWVLKKKITPGEFVTMYEIRSPDNTFICEVGPTNQMANGHLLETAPEMLDLLKSVRKSQCCCDGYSDPEMYGQMKYVTCKWCKVIAKAEGQE